MDFEKRSVLHYCFLRQMKAPQIKAEMTIAYKEEAPALSTINKWLKRFQENEESLNDKPRAGRPINYETNDAILGILQEQPFASARYIAHMLKINKSTVTYKLINQLHYQKLNCKWVPHELSPENKKKRVQMSQGILEILEKSPNNFINVLSGDEIWIFWENYNLSQWLPQGSKRPIVPKQTINSKKTMFSIFFSLRGFIVVKNLPNDEKFNSTFMIETILPEIDNKMKIYRPKSAAKGIFIHMDNAPCHNSKATIEEITKYGMIRLPHPPYSPDISPCDFWLFGHLKEYLKGHTFSNEKELFDEVHNFLNSIEKDEIKKVYNEWIQRLHTVIENKGEYILK